MPEGSRAKRLALWSYVLVFVSTVVVYAPSLRNGPVWDDLPLVIDNPNLRGLQGLGNLFTKDLWSASAQGEPSSFYRPITMLSFWLNALVGGRSVVSYRLGNIVLHASNALLLLALLRQRRVVSPRWAPLPALLWAVAPASSEPVLWISGRFDLLVVSFALTALLAGDIARRSLGTDKHRWALPLTLVAVAAGTFSKESFVAWLPILAVDDWLFGRSEGAEEAPGRARHLALKYGGVFAAVAAYFLARYELALPSTAVALRTGLWSLVESFFFLVSSFWRLLVWPTNLDPFRPYVPPSSGALALTLGLFTLATVLCVRWLWQSRSSAAKLAVLGWAWFVLSTVPSALVGPNLDMIGDRYAYLPVVGLVCTAAALLGSVLRRRDAPQQPRQLRAYAAALGVVAILGVELWLNVGHFADWHDDAALARSSLASSPGNPYALYWLGSAAVRQGDLATADKLLSDSIARDGRSWRTWNAICVLRLRQNRLDEAEKACRAGLERHPINPRGWVNLASIGVHRRDWHAVDVAASRAVELKPGFAEARYLAAVAAANLGRFDDAERHLASGLALEPNDARLRDLERQLAARRQAP